MVKRQIILLANCVLTIVLVAGSGCAHHAKTVHTARASFLRGDLEDARAQFESLVTDKKNGSEAILADQAIVSLAMGRPSEAESMLRQFAVTSNIKGGDLEGRFYWLQGEIAAAHQQWDEAVEYAHKSRGLAVSSRGVAQALLLLGQVQQQSGDQLGALTTLEELLQDSSFASLEPAYQLMAYSLASKNASGLGQSSKMRSYGRQALERLESISSQIQDTTLLSHWRDNAYQTYVRFAVSLLVDDSYRELETPLLSSAFRVIELAQGYALVSTRLRRRLPIGELSTSEVHNPLWSDINSLRRRRIASDDTAEQRALQQQEQDLIALLRSRSGVDSVSLTPRTIYPADHIQTQLFPNQGVLSFFEDSDAVHYFYIDGTEIRHGQLATSATEIRDLSARLKQAHLSRNRVEQKKHRLEMVKLISSLRLPVDLAQLVVSGAEILGEISLAELLLASDLTPPNRSSYLREGIVHTSSLSTFFSESPRRSATLAMQQPNGVVVAAPNYMDDGSIPKVDDAAVRGGLSSRFSQLPYALKEAKHISRLLPATAQTVWLGRSATAKNLLSPEARNATLLHIATHGYLNREQPELGGLALSSDVAHDHNGFLTLAELFVNDFRSELVVLSGCDTALGSAIYGEGVRSVSRELLLSGANSVISTLWPVSDRGSARFMEKFYNALIVSALPPAAALRRAQQEMIREGAQALHWAGYRLSGVHQTKGSLFRPTTSK